MKVVHNTLKTQNNMLKKSETINTKYYNNPYYTLFNTLIISL